MLHSFHRVSREINLLGKAPGKISKKQAIRNRVDMTLKDYVVQKAHGLVKLRTLSGLWDDFWLFYGLLASILTLNMVSSSISLWLIKIQLFGASCFGTAWPLYDRLSWLVLSGYNYNDSHHGTGFEMHFKWNETVENYNGSITFQINVDCRCF